MGMFWKVMVALMLTLPAGAYVAGTLLAVDTRMPQTRAPIVMSVGAPRSGGTGRPAGRPSATPGPSQDPRVAAAEPTKPGSPQPTPPRAAPVGGGGGNDQVQVIRPRPHELDDRGRDVADLREDRAERAAEARDRGQDAAETRTERARGD